MCPTYIYIEIDPIVYIYIDINFQTKHVSRKQSPLKCWMIYAAPRHPWSDDPREDHIRGSRLSPSHDRLDYLVTSIISNVYLYNHDSNDSYIYIYYIIIYNIQ